jgi:small GTP-binding protein
LIKRLLAATPDILLAYDDIRRRENEALVRLVDTLPRVDGLPQETIAQARDAVFHTDHPFLLTLIGTFGAGKSSLINALLGEEVLETGPIPTTDHVAILRYGDSLERIVSPDGSETIYYPAPLLKILSLVDTPGLESVFAAHGERTDSFLHRSDWVVFVMLATRVLTANNLEYLASLKQYGKRVLVLVNQIDLLDDDQRATVREFVQAQVVAQLGGKPEVFLLSSRQGLAARSADPVDEALWQASGMAMLEDYLLQSLDDRERLRQKLQTPLQIARNVLSAAQNQVVTQQDALDRHRSVQENITAQIEAGRGQQRAQVDDLLNEVAGVFAETSQRGEDAIRELFQPTRALSQIFSGIGELFGLGGLARRFGARSRAETAFAEHGVMEPLSDLPQLVADLGPRLEGRDMQDFDDLVVYTQKSIADLPESMQTRIIGEVKAPAAYKREALREARGDLDGIVEQARRVETNRLDRVVRNALIMLAGWELAIVVAIVLLGTLAVDWSDLTTPLLLVLGALALMFLGVGLMTFRGYRLARQFSDRIFELSQAYQDTLREAAEEQIKHGVQLRQEIAAPFVRLINAQVTRQTELSGDLQKLEHELSAIASEIGGFWEQK